jgi:hypothetical protein
VSTSVAAALSNSCKILVARRIHIPKGLPAVINGAIVEVAFISTRTRKPVRPISTGDFVEIVTSVSTLAIPPIPNTCEAFVALRMMFTQTTGVPKNLLGAGAVVAFKFYENSKDHSLPSLSWKTVTSVALRSSLRHQIPSSSLLCTVFSHTKGLSRVILSNRGGCLHILRGLERPISSVDFVENRHFSEHFSCFYAAKHLQGAHGIAHGVHSYQGLALRHLRSLLILREFERPISTCYFMENRHLSEKELRSFLRSPTPGRPLCHCAWRLNI